MEDECQQYKFGELKALIFFIFYLFGKNKIFCYPLIVGVNRFADSLIRTGLNGLLQFCEEIAFYSDS